MEEKLAVGFIRSPHGLAGKVKVESASGESTHFMRYTEITVRTGENEKKYTVESIEGTGEKSSTLIMKLKGIDTSDEAKKLSHSQIFMPKALACPLYKDEYYIDDLCKCALIYSEASNPVKVMVGTITGVLEGGESDLLEVALSESTFSEQTAVCENLAEGGVLKNRISSEKTKTVLIPFRKEFIGAVDIKNKTVELLHLWLLE